jgi:ubiquinol-cytochrome c reductase cytochrome b subunit
MGTAARAGGVLADQLDQRLTVAAVTRRNLRKVFPDHWSFLLGEIALYSFIVLLLTGTFLTFFFKPSMTEVVYDGSYVPLKGVTMSEAYGSTLDISFEVRGGLLIRQIHHWAALIFIAAIMIHAFRQFFTGSYRKPREITWLLGFTLLVLALAEGFVGYSLPDDLLSGTGLRIADGVVRAIPVAGTYLEFLAFGGEFPGDASIPRLYILHVLLIPALLAALVVAHIGIVWYQKHTQWPGPGRAEGNVVGKPFLPVYTAKAGGLFFVVFGVTALLGGLAQINPVWLYGPYHPQQVSTGSQPDWYLGFLEGAVRIMPNWEINAYGYTLSLNIAIPALIVPGILFGFLASYPFLERWVTADDREHHLLQRPRNHPVRTGLGVAWITAYGVLFLAAGNDLLAHRFHLSINAITWTCRVLFLVAPAIAFAVTKRICLGLQRRDREAVLHGRATGRLVRMPNGAFVEVHVPLPPERRHVLTAHEVITPIEPGPSTDGSGIPGPHGRTAKIRAALSRWMFSDRIAKPTTEEYRQFTGERVSDTLARRTGR